MKIMLIQDGVEHLPESIVLKSVSHHRAGSALGDHSGIVRPDERIDPEERVALARYPEFSGCRPGIIAGSKHSLAIP